jgi:hypothetical protein
LGHIVFCALRVTRSAANSFTSKSAGIPKRALGASAVFRAD